MKKLTVFTILLLCTVSLTACSLPGNQEENDTTKQQDIILPPAKKIPVNDFSGLNRDIVNIPISYDECVQMSGTVQEGIPEDPYYFTCNLGKQSFYKFTNRPKKEGIEKYDFGDHNGYINNILSNLTLPIEEQNSLIELFFLGTGKLEKTTTPIKMANPKFLSNNEPPHIKVSGPAMKDYIVSWKNHNLIITYKQTKEGEKQNTIIITRDNENKETYYPDDKGKKITEMVKDTLGQPIILHVDKIEEQEYNSPQKTTPQLTIQIDNIDLEDLGYDQDYCFESICFDPKSPIYTYKNRYLQNIEIPIKEGEEDTSNQEAEKTIILVNTKENIGIKIEQFFMSTSFSYITKNPKYTFLKIRYEACGPSDLSQIFFNGENTVQMPETISLWGIPYKKQNLTYIEEKISTRTQNKRGATKEYTTPFTTIQELQKTIEQDIKEKGLIYNTYFFRIASYPNIVFQYSNTSGEENPEAVYYTDKKISTDTNNNITDRATTKDLFCYLRHAMNDQDEKFCQTQTGEVLDPKGLHIMMFFDEDKERSFDYLTGEESRQRTLVTNKKILPLYKAKESKEKGYYFIYPSEGVYFDNGGYGCKPVVYLYDKKERKNTLSIQLPKYGSFTKLIPDFKNKNIDRTNTWEFTADKESTITVDGKQYPYLYYSTLRANYKNNQLARTVAYDDIEFFLNDKLNKMNFNAKEKADFLEYRLPEFKPGFVYGISFKFNEEFAPYAQLNFTHTPEKSFRMFMEAHQYPLSTRVNFDRNRPDLGDTMLQRFDRGSEFDMLEWGGNLEKIDGKRSQ